DLPHWLVESFKSTLESVYRADLVLLIVDVSEPIEEIREKLMTSHDTLYERNEAPIVTVLNKVDQVEPEELRDKREALSPLAPEPVAVSAIEETNIERLKERIQRELPERQRERLVLPMTEDTMSVVSWVHDNAFVEEVEYRDEEVILDFQARPAIVEQTRAKASDLAADA
ncbi:MAG: GTPase HflX, partial [Halodesulfurarchaeum sp.]|nr:GTPase HflX [Halodesulfurarchaeum sp.]